MSRMWVESHYVAVHLGETAHKTCLELCIRYQARVGESSDVKSTKFTVCATMDAHFNKMLAPTGPFPDTPAITFIASAAFAGKKEDFKFQKGSRGIGYYYDRVQVNEKKERAQVEENNAKVGNKLYLARISAAYFHPSRFFSGGGRRQEAKARQ